MSERGAQEVAFFAELMLGELRENEHKGDWLALTQEHAIAELMGHVAKLVAVARAQPDELGLLAHYGADVGNCAMMLLDVYGALGEHVLPALEESHLRYHRPEDR